MMNANRTARKMSGRTELADIAAKMLVDAKIELIVSVKVVEDLLGSLPISPAADRFQMEVVRMEITAEIAQVISSVAMVIPTALPVFLPPDCSPVPILVIPVMIATITSGITISCSRLVYALLTMLAISKAKAISPEVALVPKMSWNAAPIIKPRIRAPNIHHPKLSFLPMK